MENSKASRTIIFGALPSLRPLLPGKALRGATSRLVEVHLYQARPVVPNQNPTVLTFFARTLIATTLEATATTTTIKNSAVFTYILCHRSCCNIFRRLTTIGSLPRVWISPWHCIVTEVSNWKKSHWHIRRCRERRHHHVRHPQRTILGLLLLRPHRRQVLLQQPTATIVCESGRAMTSKKRSTG